MIHEALKTSYKGHMSIRFYIDSFPLSKLYSVDSKMEELFAKRVNLKSGANLIIEYTEAMTVIDVNTAKCITKKDKDNVITIIENFGSDSIVEIYIHQLPEFLNNKTIHESKIKSEYNINILSIKRNKRLIDITRNTVISTNDTLLAYGSFQSIKDCFTVQNKTKVELVEVKKKFNEIDLIDNYGSNAMVEVTIQEVPEIIKNKSLIESGLKDKYGINVMIIKREGEVIDVLKDTILQNGDKIVVFGNYQAIKNIFLY
jgi:Trk K+ transport system NAD-binding subunit